MVIKQWRSGLLCTFWVTMLIGGGATTAAQDQGAASAVKVVPVTEEPLHDVKHRGKHFMIYTNWIEPGDWTLYHEHRSDLLAVIVADTATVSQKLHGKPKEQSVPAGTLGFFPYSDAAAPYVHRVTARGAGPFINIGLDFQDPVTAACASTLPRWNEARAEGLEPNRRGQGYRLTLPPAADVALPTGGRGLLLAPLGSAALQVDDDAWAAKVGDFRFYDIEGERPARLRNNGKEGATLIVFDAC